MARFLADQGEDKRAQVAMSERATAAAAPAAAASARTAPAPAAAFAVFIIPAATAVKAGGEDFHRVFAQVLMRVGALPGGNAGRV